MSRIDKKRDYETALKEIRAGYKCTHWMWYIFPQISGLGFSPMAMKYEIVNLEGAKVYIENEYLRTNLVKITKALLECENDDIEENMGFPDNLKLCSGITLFEDAAPEIEEFGKVIERFYDGKEIKGY